MITDDEAWIYVYDVETFQQSSEWRSKNEPKSKKGQLNPSVVLRIVYCIKMCENVVFLLVWVNFDQMV